MLPLIFTSSAAFAIFSLALGSLWYGPLLFGKRWMRLMGVDQKTVIITKEMKKECVILYTLQFLLSVIQGFIVTILFINTIDHSAPFLINYQYMLFIAAIACIGFTFPTLAGACLWTGEKPKARAERFLIQIGYQLILACASPALFIFIVRLF